MAYIAAVNMIGYFAYCSYPELPLFPACELKLAIEFPRCTEKPVANKTWAFNSTIGLCGVLLLFFIIAGIYWSAEPNLFDVRERALQRTDSNASNLVTGFVTTSTLIEVIRTLLDKPGGYIRNDKLSPGLLLDNIKNWEYGVVIESRDLARALRNDISRSQTQSTEDTALAEADPQLNFDTDSWLFPSTESQYRKSILFLEDYLERLADTDASNAQFYSRADNLREWLHVVGNRLGSLSQRLSASVGQERLNTDLAGEAEASQSTLSPAKLIVKTPWMEIDDVFYEARGHTWALIHFLKAIEIDFQPILQRKNAVVSLRQIIRELETTQQTVWSPMILNGSGFGILINHSLILASYISRANAAVIDLRNLLEQG